MLGLVGLSSEVETYRTRICVEFDGSSFSFGILRKIGILAEEVEERFYARLENFDLCRFSCTDVSICFNGQSRHGAGRDILPSRGWRL